MAWGDEEDGKQALLDALMYGGRDEEQPAPAPVATAAQPVAPAAPPMASASPSASPDDDYLKVPQWNPPTRPASLDTMQGQIAKDQGAVSQYGKPLDPNAYKPSVGRRLLGSLFAGMMQFGHVPGALQNGEDAIWAKYNQAEADRQKNLKAATEQLASDRDQYNTQDRDWQNNMNNYERGYNYQNLAYERGITARDRQAQEQQRLAAIKPGSAHPQDPNNPLGDWVGVNLKGEQTNANEERDKWLKTPQGIAAQRDADVTRLKLTGDDAKYYRANGKLREPAPQTNIRMPSAESEMLHDWEAAFKKQYGRAPNATEIEQYKRGGRGSGNGSMSDAQSRIIIQKKNDDMAKAQRAYQNAMSLAENDDDRQKAEDDYLDSAETAQRAFEEQIRQKTGNEIDPYDIRGALKSSLHGGQPAQQQPKPTQPQPAPTQPQRQQQSAPQQATATLPTPKQPGQKLDADTARKFLAAAKGDKDKARQLAKQQKFSF